MNGEIQLFDYIVIRMHIIGLLITEIPNCMASLQGSHCTMICDLTGNVLL